MDCHYVLTDPDHGGGCQFKMLMINACDLIMHGVQFEVLTSGNDFVLKSELPCSASICFQINQSHISSEQVLLRRFCEMSLWILLN